MGYEQNGIRLGFVAANRGSFSDELAAKMRGQAVEAIERTGATVVVPDAEQTKVGCVENRHEAEVCADLFRRQNVEGIVIGAVNFGDEQAAAWVVRQAKLDVPVLIFGCQEEETLTIDTPRRDAFCGLLSIGDVLRQIGVPYTVARRPICFPSDESFAADLDWFARICRVVNGVRGARYGQIGTRPDAFWTCRYDEKKLQRLGPTTVVMDLSELLAGVTAISDSDSEVKGIARRIGDYADPSSVSPASVIRSAKLELFLRRWRRDNDIDGLAMQCWTSIQKNYGVCACATLGRLGEEGIPAACEADILGTLSMHAAMLAGGSPAALADWNNLHNEDDELANLWHCGVFPKTFAKGDPKLGYQRILVAAGGAPRENAECLVEFACRPSPVTLCRVTQDPDGPWRVMLAEGRIEDNPAETFGSYGWCRIANLQRLYRDVLLRHFPHHVAMTQSHVGNVLWEAFGNYLGMDVHHATQQTPGLYTPTLPF